MGISQRTSARYRALGLPYLEFAGLIWIHKPGGRDWIAARVRRRNRAASHFEVKPGGVLITSTRS